MTRFALFYQSVISDWNHGNAHFLRGMMRALQARGHSCVCYEAVDNWSLVNLLQADPHAIDNFRTRFPDLSFERYILDESFESWLRACLAGSDVAIVHEWNDARVIRLVGALCRELGVRALFHDTHYRVVLDDHWRVQLQLEQFERILAYSPSVADRYRQLGFESEKVSVLHEAADTTVYSPLHVPKSTDVVFVGNYGDGDRSDELEDYVFEPRASLPSLSYAVYGVRYPESVVERFRNGLDINYRGWLPNVEVPAVYSAARVVLHVPRRQYVELLPGTPTIRVFEALASGACLISLPWQDTDGLFSAGTDYAVAHSPTEMRDLIAALCSDDVAREAFGQHGRRTILERHTCGHRADQLLDLLSQ
ncbi:MAG: glycosyltransferase [Chloroflexi bacterium]|nr:glycosyltransferase [Chloroflexota bacterium]